MSRSSMWRDHRTMHRVLSHRSQRTSGNRPSCSALEGLRWRSPVTSVPGGAAEMRMLLAGGDDKTEGIARADVAEVMLLGLVPERVPCGHEDRPLAGQQSSTAGRVVPHLDQHSKID